MDIDSIDIYVYVHVCIYAYIHTYLRLNRPSVLWLPHQELCAQMPRGKRAGGTVKVSRGWTSEPLSRADKMLQCQRT